MTDCSPELIRAASAILQDLRRCQNELGGAFARALVAAAEGGEVPATDVLVAAIEAGRQAVALNASTSREDRRDREERVEINTLRRFVACGREFEPQQHYRLTPVEFAEVEQRAALEPHRALYTRLP